MGLGTPLSVGLLHGEPIQKLHLFSKHLMFQTKKVYLHNNSNVSIGDVITEVIANFFYKFEICTSE